MNQPNLGKKIIELRKAQGFTQKELVDKCNLNIRTLQRIESGEVTPRGYTLKLILTTLNYQGEDLSTKKKITFNNKTAKIIFSLLFIASITSFFYLYTNTKESSILEVKKKIETSRKKITNWVNEGNVDAIVSKYKDDACISTNSICGKKEISKALKKIMPNGYQIIKHDIISINCNDTIAYEKFITIFKYKEKVGKQNGIVEWNLHNNQWLINKELYTEEQ
jgi:transcriptional regulator with XRE-family HTH domain